MELKEIKRLIKGSASVLVLDNGEPSYVIMDYKTYKDVIASNESREIKLNHPSLRTINGPESGDRELEILERLNKEILSLKNQIELEEKGLE